MYLNFTVKVPAGEKGITRKTIKGTTYIYYETGRTYDKGKKNTVPQTTTIGKQSEDDSDTMIPNTNYIRYFPDAELPEELPSSTRSSCLKSDHISLFGKSSNITNWMR